jgi:cytidine deaminase
VTSNSENAVPAMAEDGGYQLPDWIYIGAPVAVLTANSIGAPATEIRFGTIGRIGKRDVFVGRHERYPRKTLARDWYRLVAPDDPEVTATAERAERHDVVAGVAAWLEQWRHHGELQYLARARTVLDDAIAAAVLRPNGTASPGGPVTRDTAPRTGELAELEVRARDAATHAYAPHSGFRVGAAVRCADGTIITGCNIENASYPLSQCAERTALATAVAAGHRPGVDLVALAIAFPDAPLDAATSERMPCGACRQVAHELLRPDATVIIDGAGTFTIDQLLPAAFTFHHEPQRRADDASRGDRHAHR